MSIRIIPARRVRKVKTENGREVLRRLEEYLESECDDPVEILCGFWKDQQDAITYQELRQAVLDGALTTETLELWRQDYSILVADRLNNMWTKAIEAGPKGQPILDSLAFEFNTQTPGIFDWLGERGANFVTVCTQEQKDAIAALLTKKMREGHTVDELARLIRPCIGLTEGQAKANARYYDNIVANLRKEHPRMKIESIRKKAREAALKYAERQHRERAFTIAQTESAFAYNRGADEGIWQAQAEGYLGIVKKGGVHPAMMVSVKSVHPWRAWRLIWMRSLTLRARYCSEVTSYCLRHIRDAPVQSNTLRKHRTAEGSEGMRKFSELIEKSNPDNVIKSRFRIMKSDDEKMLAFGWANVSMRVDGELIEDWQADIIEPEELENAAYEYVLLYREGGEMHERGGVAVLIESVVFTEEKMQAMGIPAGTLPVGWWIGFKITDKDVWEKVKNGTYQMFSIEGEAERVEVRAENTL